jgi:hypothetical protein
MTKMEKYENNLPVFRTCSVRFETHTQFATYILLIDYDILHRERIIMNVLLIT